MFKLSPKDHVAVSKTQRMDQVAVARVGGSVVAMRFSRGRRKPVVEIEMDVTSAEKLIAELRFAIDYVNKPEIE
jgi:hypothetical protein